ncbi:MAG TPA: TadE/TadG family type IV pilus assembly protein [Candidatus Sulfopaludibacter sp.]|jgi:Flp pilus assembly protein TadG|nr:TadE/TadG family type IV pilus assembly protein [Candidatus Sulfopaludibacter sp.]
MKMLEHPRRSKLRKFARSERGAAAVELALALFLLTIPVLNVIDLSFFAFTWMQTQNAAQMGAQAAFSNCNLSNSLPATTQCYGSQSSNNMTMFDVVNQGIQESALANSVTLTSSSVVEGYYCSTTSGVLTQVGSPGAAYADTGMVGASPSSSDVAPVPTSTCGSGFADTNATPGDYVQVNVTHSYLSIFGFVSVASLLPSVMTATAYARLD